MNIVNKAFLKLAVLPSGFYQKIGVNVVQLKSILVTKLTMDDRRTGVLAQARNSKKDKKVSLATVGTMVMSAILGTLFLFVFFFGSDISTRLTFYFSLFFFMLSLTLIADFTSVLIDVRDNFIILPKPVSDRTFVVARLLHIFIHICKIVVPMSLAGVVYMAVHYGAIGCLLFLAILFMVTAFSIFFINAVYILILKLTTPQRFQAIISYVQILFAIVVYASYQVFPRLISNSNMENFTVTSKPAIVAYPLYWFALLWKCLFSLQGSWQEFSLAFLALLVPVASLYIVIKYLAPSFNNKLALIAGSGAGTDQKRSGQKARGGSYASILARLFTRNSEEKMGFLFAWKMTSRSRDFKIKVYPSIGYLLVYVFLVFYRTSGSSLSPLEQETAGGKALIISALYFSSFILIMALGQITFSDKYKASWIYYTAPLTRPGEIILGAAKAAMLKFYIPMVVVITVAGVWITGVKILPNILLGLSNQLLIAMIMVYAGNKMFPFSTPQSNNVKAGSFIRGVFVLAISALIALGHYMIYSFVPAVLLCLLLSAIALWFISDSIRNISWQAIRSSYTED